MFKSMFFVLSAVVLSMLNSATSSAAEPKYVQLTTTEGAIILELEVELAPISSENFISYVEKGHYDGTVFHRVVKDFMIQGGGYDKSDLKKEKSTGKGIKNEGGNGLTNQKYTVAMARTSDPNSATSQFFINTSDKNSFLDRRNSQDGFGYAVFAKVIQGKDVVDKIAAMQVKRSATGEVSEPLKPVEITKAEMVVPVK